MSRRLVSALRGLTLPQEALALLSRDSATLGRAVSHPVRSVSASSKQNATSATSASVDGSKASSLSFEDHEAIFKGQSTGTLLRSLAVFTACTIPGFVEAAPTLLRLSRSWLGERATMELIRRTFFAQFCGGEDEKSLQGKVRELRARNVGSILDYAAEDDIPTPVAVPAAAHTSTPSASEAAAHAPTNPFHPATTTSTSTSTPTASAAPEGPDRGKGPGVEGSGELAEGTRLVLAVPPGPAVARQYCYESESKCEAHLATFLSSIASAGRMPGQGFAAVKLTALGNPLLLKRVSTAIRVVQGLFAQWDTDGNQVIDRSEFEAAYRQMLPDAAPEEHRRVFEWLDQQKGDKIDYVAWCQRVSLTKMPELAARIAASQASGSPPASTAGGAWRESLHSAALTPEEVQLVQAMRARLRKIAAAAAEAKVKLLVDAEHSFFQPAIDHLCLELCRAYNRGPEGAVIFNTYQAYLTDTPSRLVVDLERARREKYVLGAKLVRGAYMEIERERARSKGYESPVWPTIEQTHRTYDGCAKVLLQAVQRGRAEVLFGTHNQQSIELVVHDMATLGLDPAHSKVYFGQLLGMADHLTQVLGGHGFQAFKYVPYGAIDLVVPYLLRRATENASIMKGSKRDVLLLRAELLRRAKAAVGLGK